MSLCMHIPTDLIHINLSDDDINLSLINKDIISKVLDIYDGNKTKAGEVLHINRNTIRNILK